MGIFHKVGGWLANKSDQFIRGGMERESGYYATREARDAYSGMNTDQEMSNEAGEQSERRPALDPFGRGDGDYGGRVPYRSKYDMEMEAYHKAQQQQAAMQQSARRPAVHPNMQTQPQQGMPQQAMPQQAMPQQAMPQQSMLRQNMPQQPTAAPQAAYSQSYSAPVNNVVPFPGMQHGPNGMVYAHVEYVVLLRSRNECKSVIGYIKTNASVFLNMEFIASDSERQRCVDMLSGAAYTLGCALNKISPRGIYLISAPTVKVVLDPAMQKMSSAQESQGFVRQRYEQDAYQSDYPQQPAPRQSDYPQQPAPRQSDYPQQIASRQSYEQPAPFAGGFTAESPTARFQAQGAQSNRPVSFGSAMAGNRTGSYPIASAMVSGQNHTDRYAAVDYPQ